jgi:arginyl-tRNA--protein-N-Asp/Glu arginylyltransferase
MTKPLSGDLQFFFGTLPQPCPYLPDRLESKIVTELGGSGAHGLHEELSRAGFRRSHGLVYKPACTGCQACIPVRVPVADFEFSRSLRRVWRRNKDLTAVESPARGTAEQYAVFARYQQWRHGDGGMATMNLGDYKAMVEDTPIDTTVVEFRDDEGRFFGASLTDRLSDGLSGVYKFFDPTQPRRSAGTFIVLWHIERARELGLPYVYLGYWIADCRKMAYKTRFRPIEALGPTGWRVMTSDLEGER